MNNWTIAGRLGQDAVTRREIVGTEKRIRRRSASPLTKSEIEAFTVTVPESGCWIWVRGVDKCGYGKTFVNGRHLGAHRASYMAFKGPIPTGVHVRHTCDIPACCNPDHLIMGTPKENAADRVSRGRTARMAGEKNPSAKIDRNTAERIKRSNGTHSAVAREFGVSISTAWSIRTGRSWSSEP